MSEFRLWIASVPSLRLESFIVDLLGSAFKKMSIFTLLSCKWIPSCPWISHVFIHYTQWNILGYQLSFLHQNWENPPSNPVFETNKQNPKSHQILQNAISKTCQTASVIKMQSQFFLGPNSSNTKSPIRHDNDIHTKRSPLFRASHRIIIHYPRIRSRFVFHYLDYNPKTTW